MTTETDDQRRARLQAQLDTLNEIRRLVTDRGFSWFEAWADVRAGVEYSLGRVGRGIDV